MVDAGTSQVNLAMWPNNPNRHARGMLIILSKPDVATTLVYGTKNVICDKYCKHSNDTFLMVIFQDKPGKPVSVSILDFTGVQDDGGGGDNWS